jgi:hypothetical protein
MKPMFAAAAVLLFARALMVPRPLSSWDLIPFPAKYSRLKTREPRHLNEMTCPRSIKF